MTRLCVGASSGGHMTELAGVLEHTDLWPVAPSLMVATLGNVSDTNNGMKQYAVGECNRNTPLQVLKVFLRSCRIVWRERPDVVVTTGSMPLAIFSIAARLGGAKIIWIDSISQVDGISMSGKLVKPFASLFFVQWPELAERFEGTVYAGELV